MKNKNVIGISPMTLVIATVFMLMSTDVAMATVWTDQADYPPGSVVTISGNNSDGIGYIAGETVNVHVDGPSSYDSSCSGTADSLGVWSCQIILASDLSAEGRYNYTATGQTSKVAQSGTFTDGFPTFNVKFSATGLPDGTTIDVVVDYTQPNGQLKTGQTKSFTTPNAGGNTGTKPETQFKYTYPGSIPVSGTTYYLIGTSQVSPFTTGADGGSLTVTATYHPDTTPPVITPTVTGTLGTNGWYTTNVGVSWTVTDAESAITSQNGCGATTISADTTGTTLTCTATSGGGTNSQSVTIRRDATPPTVTASPTRTSPDYNGWYNEPVTIFLTGSDTGSGMDTCDPSVNYNTDNAAASVSGNCKDNAGNVGTGTFSFKYDGTSPTAVLAVTSGTKGTNGWYTSDVTVSTSGTDSVSSPVTCTADQYMTGDTIDAIFNGKCTNGAGLSTDATSLTVKLDETGPTATLSVTKGTLGDNGWYVTDVTVHTDGSDTVSNPVTCTADQSFTNDMQDAAIKGTCTNDAGLSTDASSLNIKIDKTPPTVTASPDRIADHNGWYNKLVTVSFSGTDPTSGMAGCDSSVGYNTPDSSTASVSGTCRDNAGNIGTGKLDFKYDETSPVINSDASTSDGVYTTKTWTNKDVTVHFIATDPVSGIGTVTPDTKVSAEGADQSVTGSATDMAGNTASTSFTGINIDKTPPTITGSRSPLANANGWNNADVTVHFYCGDSLSGVDSCTSDNTLSSEAAGQSASGTAKDKAGNIAITTVGDINIDKTAPDITASADRSADYNGWYNKQVTVSFAGTDSLSGIDSCDKTPYNSLDSATASVSGTCKDKAGNVGTGSLSFRYDATPPTITGSRDPLPNTNSWNNVDVKVHFDCGDATSGIASCTPDATVSTEGKGQSVAGIATDQAGNTASATVGDINIDKTPPSITASAYTSDGIYTSGTWTNKDVKVHFSCGDVLSGVASCTLDTTVSTEGSDQSLTGSVTDKAGNPASVTFSGINIDKSAPVITITTPVNGASYILNQPVAVDYACTDPLSGVATCSGNVPKGSNIDTGSIGTKIFTVNSADNAGNSGTKSATYYVKYIFGGILQPINADGSSIFKFGSTVPVKFQLTDYNGNYISTAVATISVAKIDNNVEGTYVEAISTSAATVGNLFRYDSTSNQYIFNLATKPLSTGTWNIKISINDGTTYAVKISLK